MYEISALLLIILLSILAVKAGAVALTLTGLSMDLAIFQSLSAFTGTGFTTKESETIVSHAARRKIIQALMLLGNAGLFSALAALIVGFSQAEGKSIRDRLLITIAGLLVLLFLSSVDFLNRILNTVLQGIFKRLPLLQIHDYESLLRINKGYTVSQFTVEADTWLDGQTLRQLALISEGVLVLSIEREDGGVLGTPGPNSRLLHGDQLLIYGKEADLTALAQRDCGPEGNVEHERAIQEQGRRRATEAAGDPG